MSITRDAQMLIGTGLDVMADKYPRLFMGMVHHRTTIGKHLTFRDKQWLAAIYKDPAHEMVIMKCSQVHQTEHALCAMFTLANKGKRGMYVLPSKEHRKTFVTDRIDPLMDNSPLYANAIKPGEGDSNVYKKIFGHGWKFVGSNIKKDFFEFPCDVLFFDEYDQLDQDNLWYAYDRIVNSQNPYIWKFGNPTRDNWGIHAAYLASDQKEWYVECPHCGKEQILDWYEHFVMPYHNTWRLRDPAGQPVCSECNESFDRLSPGHWVALNPGVGKPSGYRITRLFINKQGKKRNKDVYKLFKKFIDAQHNPTALQNFHNNYLAATYENINFKLTHEILARSVWEKDDFEFDPAMFRTVMGVDQGKKFTCVISMVWDGDLIDIHYANVNRWEDVEKLERDFNVICTVIDAAGGGFAETRDFVKKKGDRWMCYYRPKDQIQKDYKLNYTERIVATNRTEILDLMVKMLIDKKAHVRADFAGADSKRFIKQMLASARVTDTGGHLVWTKGEDHYFHSSAYRYLAYRICGMYNSAIADRSWRVTRSTVVDKPKPQASTIGDPVDDGKPTQDQRKPKRRWHV